MHRTSPIEIPNEMAGHRMDLVVSTCFSVSRSVAREALEQGRVLVNSVRAAKGRRAQLGDRLQLVEDFVAKDFVPIAQANANVRIVADEADFVVLDKPAGVPSHPLAQSEMNTVANVLAALSQDFAVAGRAQRECGLMHRLDTNTSGLICAARTSNAFVRLKAAFSSASFDKRYLALVEGNPPIGSIDIPLVPSGQKKMRAARLHDAEALSAHSEILRVEEFGHFSLVEVRALHARRHQVRVHLAALGYPLLGDLQYGGSPRIDRHALHASHLSFDLDGRRYEFESQLPEDLASLGDWC